jgi:hypothetical protein
MSQSPPGIPKPPAIAAVPSPSAADPAALDLRTASASRLITELMHVEDLLQGVDVHDPNVVPLIGRGQSIQAELSQRQARSLPGLRWATLSTNPSSRPPGHLRLSGPRDRKVGRRDDAGGPGRWSD